METIDKVAEGIVTGLLEALVDFTKGRHQLPTQSVVATIAAEAEHCAAEVARLNKMTILECQIAAQKQFSMDMAYHRTVELQIVRKRARVSAMLGRLSRAYASGELGQLFTQMRNRASEFLEWVTVPPVPLRQTGAQWREDELYKFSRMIVSKNKQLDLIQTDVDLAVDRLVQLLNWVDDFEGRRPNPDRRLARGSVLINKVLQNHTALVKRVSLTDVDIYDRHTGRHLNITREAALADFYIGDYYE